MQSLLRTRPENLKDIAIQVAIVRPGPIQGGAVNPYIERRQRLRVDPDYQIPYEHPSLSRRCARRSERSSSRTRCWRSRVPLPDSGRGRPRIYDAR